MNGAMSSQPLECHTSQTLSAVTAVPTATVPHSVQGASGEATVSGGREARGGAATTLGGDAVSRGTETWSSARATALRVRFALYIAASACSMRRSNSVALCGHPATPTLTVQRMVSWDP